MSDELNKYTLKDFIANLDLKYPVKIKAKKGGITPKNKTGSLLLEKNEKIIVNEITK